MKKAIDPNMLQILTLDGGAPMLDGVKIHGVKSFEIRGDEDNYPPGVVFVQLYFLAKTL